MNMYVFVGLTYFASTWAEHTRYPDEWFVTDRSSTRMISFEPKDGSRLHVLVWPKDIFS